MDDASRRCWFNGARRSWSKCKQSNEMRGKSDCASIGRPIARESTSFHSCPFYHFLARSSCQYQLFPSLYTHPISHSSLLFLLPKLNKNYSSTRNSLFTIRIRTTSNLKIVLYLLLRNICTRLRGKDWMKSGVPTFSAPPRTRNERTRAEREICSNVVLVTFQRKNLVSSC